LLPGTAACGHSSCGERQAAKATGAARGRKRTQSNVRAGQRLATASVDFRQHFSLAGAGHAACLRRDDLSGHDAPLRSVLAAGVVYVIPIVAAGQTFAEIRTVPTLSVTGGVTVLPVGLTVAAAAIVSLAVGLAVLLSRRQAIEPTTLTSAWWWALATLTTWAGTELVAGIYAANGSGAGFAPLRLAAMALSFCPVVALVGAKRPQHRGWNLVVASLWAIVALPAAETFFLRPGQNVAIGDARAWFLWILILLGPINFVPTRYWLASLLLAAAQVIAFSPYLAGVHQPIVPEAGAVGLLLAATAIAVAWLMSRMQSTAANSYERQWLDFRDSFGLLWGLRVQERMNAAARQYGWDLELTWRGFRTRTSDTPLDAIDSVIGPTLRTTFKGLLRRFVSNAWIEDRTKAG